MKMIGHQAITIGSENYCRHPEILFEENFILNAIVEQHIFSVCPVVNVIISTRHQYVSFICHDNINLLINPEKVPNIPVCLKKYFNNVSDFEYP
jgi:hypothetical protein